MRYDPTVGKPGQGRGTLEIIGKAVRYELRLGKAKHHALYL